MAVINPWLFYLINVLEVFRKICIICIVISGMVVLCFSVADEIKTRWKIVSAAVLSISIVGVIFIPSESTSTKMLIANFVTYENVEFTKDSIIELVDYIVEKVDGGTNTGGS